MMTSNGFSFWVIPCYVKRDKDSAATSHTNRCSQF